MKKSTYKYTTRKATQKQLAVARKFLGMASDGGDEKTPEKPKLEATGPSHRTTPTLWQSYGVGIAARSMDEWVGELMKVPKMYLPSVTEGLCRQALSDIYCDDRFSTWWFSPWYVINDRTPAAMSLLSPHSLLRIVIEKIQDYNQMVEDGIIVKGTLRS